MNHQEHQVHQERIQSGGACLVFLVVSPFCAYANVRIKAALFSRLSPGPARRCSENTRREGVVIKAACKSSEFEGWSANGEPTAEPRSAGRSQLASASLRRWHLRDLLGGQRSVRLQSGIDESPSLDVHTVTSIRQVRSAAELFARLWFSAGHIQQSIEYFLRQAAARSLG